MVVNTESVVGYNNKLKKATSFMKIGVNSDLNIPVRRSAPKHNFGRGAVKLPHSGVETQNKAKQATATAKQAETKETQVVKSEKKRKKRQRQRIRSSKRSRSDSGAGESQAQSEDCFDFAREQFECFDYYRRWVSLVSFQMK